MGKAQTYGTRLEQRCPSQPHHTFIVHPNSLPHLLAHKPTTAPRETQWQSALPRAENRPAKKLAGRLKAGTAQPKALQGRHCAEHILARARHAPKHTSIASCGGSCADYMHSEAPVQTLS